MLTILPEKVSRPGVAALTKRMRPISISNASHAPGSMRDLAIFGLTRVPTSLAFLLNFVEFLLLVAVEIALIWLLLCSCRSRIFASLSSRDIDESLRNCSIWFRCSSRIGFTFAC
jgi:hypothetical protein